MTVVVRGERVAVAVVALLCVLATAALAGRKHSPLLEDYAATKKPNRVSECQFGKQLKEIGSMWFADLGPPFGVMYCIKCECVQMQKKRRIVGRVQCRNIKNDCPKPNCEEPTLLPGKCCKSCPGEDANDFVQDTPDEEEKSMKHFAAILTGQLTKSDDFKKMDYPPTSVRETGLDVVATGRFTFYRKHLYFSFYVDRPDRPRIAQFVDTNGNIVEEITLSSGTAYQNQTDKICGVWRRVSKDYKRMLREEKISVSLVWDTAIIGGRLYRYKALDTEMFSSLLTGQTRDSGGTSIVSISTVSPSIHMQIVFRGPFDGQESGSFLVKLKYAANERAVIEETVRVDKLTNSSSVVIELQSPVTFSDLNALSKRDLVVTLEAKQSGFKLQGLVVPRVSCDIYQTLVVSNGHQVQDSPKKDRTCGVAWAFINKDGALEYRVKFDDNNAVTELAIVSSESRVSSVDLSESIVQKWSNGTVSTVGPMHLEQLYAEELSLYSASSGLKGRFVWRPVADARDAAGAMLLSGPDERTAVGLLWIAVDADCALQYEVVLSGSNVKNRLFELYIEDSPFLIPGAPVFRRLLEEFEGPTIEGFANGLSEEELSRLDVNVVHVDLWDPKLGQSVMKTQWKHVNVPAACSGREAVGHDSNNILMNNDESERQQTALSSSCLHGQQYYQHGVQWTSAVDECYMCNCHYGRVICDPIVCPTVKCAVPSAKPKTCCPTCDVNASVNQNLNSTNSCSLAGQLFQAGSSWHPYLPPNGFDTCVLCHCDNTLLKIKCQRTDCPPLECDQRVAVRPTKRACCKVCPSTLQHTTGKTTGPLVQLAQGDQQVDGEAGSDSEVLSNGGCSYPVGGPYENGQEWHPKIYSHGEVKCVNCTCKDGKVRCDRKKCPRRSCSDPCCKATCRRHRRQLLFTY